MPALFAAAFSLVGGTVQSLSPTRQAALRDNLSGGRRAAVDRYLRDPKKIHGRWVVLRVAGITATAALLGVRWASWEPWGWLAAWGVTVGVYAIPSQLVRQSVERHADTLLPQLLRAARFGEWLVIPLSDPLHLVGKQVSGGDTREPSANLTETEVEMLVNEGELNGSLAHDQSEMIRNVLDFGEVTAEEVMVPRTQVDALDAALPLAEALNEVARTQHSRYPVFSDSVDNIVGILHVKDLFHAMADGQRESVSLLELARKPVAFVPEGQLASTVLRDMRAGRHHMAVVLDEFGGVSGVLTLEDLLEEIVGDIQDEHDRDDDSTRILMVGEHTALVDASTPVTDINRAIGTELPDGDYVSLGGLLIEELGSVPPQGSAFELHGLQFVIRESDDRHIARVELSNVPGSPRDPSSRPPASAA